MLEIMRDFLWVGDGASIATHLFANLHYATKPHRDRRKRLPAASARLEGLLRAGLTA